MPPTIMLHSRHARLLPRLIDALAAEGYEGVTFRDLEYTLCQDASLPPKAVMLTIDDLSMVRGNPSFETFRGMKDALVERGWRGVFGVITGPHLPQNEVWWDEVAVWGEQGIELATHTAYHSNLNDPALTAEDFEAEIVGSAQTICQRTGQPVHALVTPFGSGYNRTTGALHPLICAMCQQARIRFVSGIVEGHGPLPASVGDSDVIYTGRVPPGIDGTLESTLFEVHHW